MQKVNDDENTIETFVITISDIKMSNHQLLHHTPTRQVAIDANARLNVMLTPAAEAVTVTTHNNNVCSDDSDATSSLTEPEKAECSICFEFPSAEEFSTMGGCDHMFCLQCITTWSEINNVCPLCRVRFTYIESTGGVLYQVPDRRDIDTALFNLRARFVSNTVRTLLALFNLEVEGEYNHPLDVVRAALDRWQPHQIRAELSVVCWLLRLLLNDFTVEPLVRINQILEDSIAELRRPSMTATCWPVFASSLSLDEEYLDQNPNTSMRTLLRRLLRVRRHIYPPETYSPTRIGMSLWESTFSIYLERVLEQTRERRVVFFCQEVEIFYLNQSDNETRSMMPCYGRLRL